MGIFNSKVAPVNKNKHDMSHSIDPRSPTVNINRSPITSENNQDKPAITKVRDLTSDLTEIFDSAQSPERAVGEKLQIMLDPRSPSTFDRTPLVLDDSNASNTSVQDASLEYVEINEPGNSSEDSSISFKDCETLPEVVTAVPLENNSLFSDMSFNTELKAQIDDIVQGLYDAAKDPRSPSINIQRTPIVFEEDDTVEEKNEPIKKDEKMYKESKKPQEQPSNLIYSNENNLVTTPKRGTLDMTAPSKNNVISAPRTPLGCVTNLKTPGNNVANNMRKTALFGQMKQNIITVENNTELVSTKVSQPRSKIPTLRLK
ncbi:uncharacterized protein LOC129768545 [Toxorhynchites rutilus septentrionalis]|uniref:uncharacterized protein LOC129768545 n=1 Tax=Toxorhynchites rutilus septentrionalis TaxID=329112 RepID=UPI002479E470|nr:uncharacterized protein LOC129768545 [Toxorhynchites rutilus septentrionalis]